jgi:hypothetical protein
MLGSFTFGSWICGSWNRDRSRMEPLGFDGSMSSPLGSGSARALSPRRLLARSGPAPSAAARGGWLWGAAPRGDWTGATAAGRGLGAGAAVRPADPATNADEAGDGPEANGLEADGPEADCPEADGPEADGAEAAGGVAAFGASTGDPEAGEAPGWLARDARIFPACVLRSPGIEGPVAGGEAEGEVDCAVLPPAGSRRAAHLGRPDGA